MVQKIDNSQLEAKLELRRHFLRRFHEAAPPTVLDCCAGHGVLWAALREEFQIGPYLGLDLDQKKKGQLRVDSRRFLAAGDVEHDVIDIDTYGQPWGHWSALLPHLVQPATVFLTIGQLVRGTVGSLQKKALDALGLGGITRLPKGFHTKLAEIAVSHCLTRSYDYGIVIEYAAEVESHNRNVRYIGVRLTPEKKASRQPRTKHGAGSNKAT